MKMFPRGFWVVFVLCVMGIWGAGSGCSDAETTLRWLEKVVEESERNLEENSTPKESKAKKSTRNENRNSAPIPKTLIGVVTRVADGDTFTLQTRNGEKYKVRCQAVDAPELAQEFGEESRSVYNELVYRKTVRVEVDKRDKYERIVGRIWCEDPVTGTWFDVEEIMLKRGMVWHYSRYNDEEKLIRAQAEAQRNRVGVWTQRNPKKPENWRIQNRENAQ